VLILGNTRSNITTVCFENQMSAEVASDAPPRNTGEPKFQPNGTFIQVKHGANRRALLLGDEHFQFESDS
jgi:hypothetical protein